MDDTKLLKTGDPCPCCGQPIKTTDPLLLQLLTRIKDEKERCDAERKADVNDVRQFMDKIEMLPK